MSRLITLREFDYLLPEDEAPRDDPRAKGIPRRDWDWLHRLLAGEEAREHHDDAHHFLRRTSRNRVPAFQVLNHVGVLRTPYGTQLEILPKVHEEKDDAEETRSMLVAMLRRLRWLERFRLGGEALLRARRMPLLEVFLRQFLDEVNHVLKRGLRSDYVTREENIAFLRGKLLVAQNIRRNLIHKHRFYCAFDEFLPDRPENRLIRRALEKVLRLTGSATNERLARELLFAFQDVPSSWDVGKDFARSLCDRSTSHYRAAIAWCRVLLQEEPPVPMPGKAEHISLLFPMERIFEDYVGSLLARTEGVEELRRQSSSKWLLEIPKKFQLKPDFVFRMDGRTIVADAKWKRIHPDAGDDKRGVSQGDLYQLYAYGKKYEASGLVLFYPETARFREPLTDWRFEENLPLILVPVPLPRREEGASIAFPLLLQKKQTAFAYRLKEVFAACERAKTSR